MFADLCPGIYSALVQLLTIAANSPVAGREPNKGALQIATFAKPLGASTVIMGLAVLLIGAL